jgi:hypothetical protein
LDVEIQRKKMKRNRRKLAILGFLAGQRRAQTVAEIGWAVRVPYHHGGLRRLLLNYRRWGLLQQNFAGRVSFYRITDRGRARLSWLRHSG